MASKAAEEGKASVGEMLLEGWRKERCRRRGLTVFH